MTKPIIISVRIVFAAILFIPGIFAFSQDFSEKQKAIIYNEAIKTIMNYELYSNELADETDMIELTKISQKLTDLFVSRKAVVYNDLDPAHKLSEAYEMETYLTNMLLWYPDGMKISLDYDNLKAGNIISHGNEIYTVDIMTNKRIDGNYLNQQKNENTEELLYRIAFFQQNSGFENYRIAGVRSSKNTTLANDSRILAEVKSVDFSEKDMQIIKEQTRFLLNDYINFLNLLTDPKETNEDKSYYSISFMGLFKDSTMSVANDIEPDPQNRWISISEYQKNLRASYPEGIKNIGMNIDSAEFGKVIPEGNENYYINGYINKFFSGKYQSKTVFRDDSKYDFKVSFQKDENTFQNFKLSSIDKFGVNLYQQTSTEEKAELPQYAITSLKRSGMYLGFSVGYGVLNYSDPNLTDGSLIKWSVAGKNSFSAEANATWYFLNRSGFSIGAAFNRFSANSNLTGSFINPGYETNDPNLDLYQKKLTAAFDSLITFNYVSLPVSFVFHSNSNPEKWGIYGEVGLINSFKMSSKYLSTGNSGISGYYEQYTIAEGQDIYDWPEMGFVPRTGINNTGKSEASFYNLAAKAFVGVSCPINYFTTAFVGPEVYWSLNNLAAADTYIDAFGNTSPTKKVGFSKYGIKFGITYKF